MALEKVFTNEKGISTSYHKLREITLFDNCLHCSVDSYVSREYRETNCPAESRYFSFNITLEEEESMGIRVLGYTKIKALDEWQGAIDC